MGAHEHLSFSPVDISVFVLSLVVSGAVGLWYALRGRTNNSRDYFVGHSPLLPTTLSTMASVISGILILSYPAEVYKMGTALCWTVVGQQMALVFSALFIVPVIYRSIGSAIRLYCAILYVLSFLMYMSIVLYAPSIALSGITNLPTWVLILSVGLVCTIYTSIGGVKAVVWTDTIQAVIMYVGLVTLVVKGVITVGGWEVMWQTAKNGSRLDGLTNIDPNPFQYMTVWTALFGGFFFWLGGFGANQTTMQRYCSMPTSTQARLVPIITMPFMLIINLLAFIIGMTMYTYYSTCDPIKAGEVKTKDQLVIYFMFQLLGSIPGLPGLFLACLFSGTLSTVSSGINSLSAVVLEEFVRPLYTIQKESTKSVVSKVIGVVFGMCCIGLAFSTGYLGGIFEAVNSALGALGGPVTGVTLLANKFGGLTGMLIGTGLSGWFFLGAHIYSRQIAPIYTPLPTHATHCFSHTGFMNKSTNLLSDSTFPVSNSNYSSLYSDLDYDVREFVQFTTTEMNEYFNNSWLNSTILDVEERGKIMKTWRKIYGLSYFMYSLVGTVSTVVVGSIVSLLTGGNDTLKHQPHLCFGGGEPPDAPPHAHNHRHNGQNQYDSARQFPGAKKSRNKSERPLLLNYSKLGTLEEEDMEENGIRMEERHLVREFPDEGFL